MRKRPTTSGSDGPIALWSALLFSDLPVPGDPALAWIPGGRSMLSGALAHASTESPTSLVLLLLDLPENGSAECESTMQKILDSANRFAFGLYAALEGFPVRFGVMTTAGLALRPFGDAGSWAPLRQAEFHGNDTLRPDPVSATDWASALLAAEMGRLHKIAGVFKVCSAIVTVSGTSPDVISGSLGYLRAMRRAAGTTSVLIGVGEEGCVEAAHVLGYGDAFTADEIPTCVGIVTDELGYERRESLRFLLDIMTPGPDSETPNGP